jgi:acyloxyacyl hydrolase
MKNKNIKLDPNFSFYDPSKGGNRTLPVVDVDGDRFSPSEMLVRGSHWRGRDCNDEEKDIFPGRYDINPNIDSNCNGIYGKDERGISYEDLYCYNSSARSIITFGDSASSGFHIPADWLKFQNLSIIVDTIKNEFDWPHTSWSTGIV